MSRILIVDDEPAICWSLKERLADQGHDVQCEASIEGAERLRDSFSPDLIVLDVRLPGRDGLSAIPDFRQRWPGVPIIIMTAFSELQTVVDALERGAFEYLVKPFDLNEFLSVVDRALKSPGPAEDSPSKTVEGTQLIGRGAAMQSIFKRIAIIAPTEFPVLITGETGTGKELVAEAIHRHSRRQDGPFVRVNLASLNPSLIESELFGHVKGSFTGATEDRGGLFELAENGTIFLDEIGDAPLTIQVKLLRVLEARSYCRVGSGIERPANGRLIAATNRDLTRMIAAATFREDLYHRLNVFSITLAPLRDRTEDISSLVHYFLSRQTVPVNTTIDSSFWSAVETRTWPGNIRELRNAIDHAVVIARGEPLAADHLPAEAGSDIATAQTTEELNLAITNWLNRQLNVAGNDQSHDLYRRFMTDAETILIRKILKHTDHNQTAAAKLLGLDRATLRSRLQTFPT